MVCLYRGGTANGLIVQRWYSQWFDSTEVVLANGHGLIVQYRGGTGHGLNVKSWYSQGFACTDMVLSMV